MAGSLASESFCDLLESELSVARFEARELSEVAYVLAFITSHLGASVQSLLASEDLLPLVSSSASSLEGLSLSSGHSWVQDLRRLVNSFTILSEPADHLGLPGAQRKQAPLDSIGRLLCCQ
jgi:hypothetical protein